MTTIAVIGAGAWGTALANVLAGKGLDVPLWVREPELIEIIRDQQENTWFLPGVRLAEGIIPSTDLKWILSTANVLLLVVPCQFIRSWLKTARPYLGKDHLVICASKGIEVSGLKTMSQVVREEVGDQGVQYAVLSGPSFAVEVSRGLPTAVVLAGEDIVFAKRIQSELATANFRVYTNTDYRGVELGGALKNVMAIAAGISDGLGFGYDARAALITRGLAEMSRLGVRLGARAETFMGLAGMGDLVLTCTGDLSRNRQVGLAIGRGEQLKDVLTGRKTVAEGVKTTEAVFRLAKAVGVEMPITEQVYQMLFAGKNPSTAVRELMTRALKMEDDG